jgi:hypothetical protein
MIVSKLIANDNVNILFNFLDGFSIQKKMVIQLQNIFTIWLI